MPDAASPVLIEVILDVTRYYQRQVYRGVLSYLTRERPDWQTSAIAGHSIPALAPVAPMSSQVAVRTGVVGYFANDQQRASLQGRALVNVSDSGDLPTPCRVVPENTAVGRLALEHLYGLGLRRFVVAHHAQLSFGHRRLRGFVEAATDAGCTVVEAHVPMTLHRPGDWPTMPPPPLGVFGVDDAAALWAQRVVQHAGLSVPNDVAIIGANNDDIVCLMGQPPLSSIDLNLFRIGELAAEMIVRQVEGHHVPARVMVPPGGVVARASTDMLAVEDAAVRSAIQFLRNHACGGLTVEDLLEHFPMSRRKLENAFTRHIGRSPYEEIQRVRFDQARALLRTTDLPMEAIANRVGYANPRHFATAFRKFTGQTPSSYRVSARAAPGDRTGLQSTGR